MRAGVRAAGPTGGCAGGTAGAPAPGPRPVRPAGALVMVRPLEAPRPVRDVAAASGVERAGAWGDGVWGDGVWGDGARRAGRGGSGPRLLVRGAVGVPGRARPGTRLRRVVAGIALVAASAAVVVALGLLARVAGARFHAGSTARPGRRHRRAG